MPTLLSMCASKTSFSRLVSTPQQIDDSVLRPDLGGGSQSRHIELDIDIGADARDWSAIQAQEKLKPVETELRRIEELVGEIVGEMDYLRSREQKLRDTNESTNERVKWFAFGTMGMLVGLGAWQVVYLRAYFRYVLSAASLLWVRPFVNSNPQIKASDLVHACYLQSTQQAPQLLHCIFYSSAQRAKLPFLSAPRLLIRIADLTTRSAILSFISPLRPHWPPFHAAHPVCLFEEQPRFKERSIYHIPSSFTFSCSSSSQLIHESLNFSHFRIKVRIQRLALSPI